MILGLHALAAFAFLTSLQGWPGVAAAGFMVALGGLAARDRALLRGPGAPRSLELGGAERGACILADGRRVPIAQGRAGVTRFWVALPLSAGRRRTLLVAAGMLAPEAFRRLRLWALWGKLPAVAGPQRTA